MSECDLHIFFVWQKNNHVRVGNSHARFFFNRRFFLCNLPPALHNIFVFCIFVGCFCRLIKRPFFGCQIFRELKNREFKKRRWENLKITLKSKQKICTIQVSPNKVYKSQWRSLSPFLKSHCIFTLQYLTRFPTVY